MDTTYSSCSAMPAENVPQLPTAKKGRARKKRNRLIFYSICISIPVLHFLIFYVYINFNSIVMAFQRYTYMDPTPPDTILGTPGKPGGVYSELAGFDNFVVAWNNFAGNTTRLWNSLLHFAVTVGISTPLALLFSYYLYKQYFLSGLFKVILFLPQILSALVLGLLFKHIVSDVYGYIVLSAGGVPAGNGNLLQAEMVTRYLTVIAFNILMGFGVNVLTYTSTMGGISDSLIESAQLDGANSLQEFFYIVIPMCYPTIITLFIVNLSHIFTNQANLYTLYAEGVGRLDTVGYFLYVQAKGSQLYYLDELHLTYPELSAYGLICTAIILPITMVTRYLLNKYGPSAD